MEDNSTILEGNIKNSIKPVSLKGMDKITEQMKYSICKIYKIFKTGRTGTGTGFLCYLPYNSIKIPFLITNHHILNEKEIENNTKITISFNNEEIFRNILIDKQRITLSNKDLDFSIIEIKNNDNINLKNILELDENINIGKEYINKKYTDESIYTLHYPKGENIVVSFGLIKGINDNKISHSCFTEDGSSGAPILTLKDFKVVGIHYGFIKGFYINKGTFIKYVLLELKKYKNNNVLQEDILNNNKNNQYHNNNDNNKNNQYHNNNDNNKINQYHNNNYNNKNNQYHNNNYNDNNNQYNNNNLNYNNINNQNINYNLNYNNMNNQYNNNNFNENYMNSQYNSNNYSNNQYNNNIINNQCKQNMNNNNEINYQNNNMNNNPENFNSYDNYNINNPNINKTKINPNNQNKNLNNNIYDNSNIVLMEQNEFHSNNFEDIYPYIKGNKFRITFITEKNKKIRILIPSSLRNCELYYTAEKINNPDFFEYSDAKFIELFYTHNNNDLLYIHNDDNLIKSYMKHGTQILIKEQKEVVLYDPNKSLLNIFFLSDKGRKSFVIVPYNIKIIDLIHLFFNKNKIAKQNQKYFSFFINNKELKLTSKAIFEEGIIYPSIINFETKLPKNDSNFTY